MVMTNSSNGTPDQNKLSWQSEYLKEILHSGEVTVTFLKKDGTQRKLVCTLKPEFIPEQASTGAERKSNPEVQAVWDLENEGWRSFRYDSILGFSIGRY